MTQKFEMADRFNPSAVEQALYQHWEESGYFKPSENENAPSYCIAIPPPNVTGSLHMGHAFQQTLMDTLIRFNRMEGHNTLWQREQRFPLAFPLSVSERCQNGRW